MRAPSALAAAAVLLWTGCGYHTHVVPSREVHRHAGDLRAGRTVTVTDRSNEEIELSADDEVTGTEAGLRSTSLSRMLKHCADGPPESFRRDDEPRSSCQLENVRSLHIERVDPEETLANFLLGGAIVGVYSGIVYCAVDCPEPWNQVSLAGAIIGGFALTGVGLLWMLLSNAHGPT